MNEFFVGVQGDRIAILRFKAVLTLEQAANLCAWMRVLVECQEGGQELLDKAYEAANT